MSYTEYLRRKAAASPVIIDTTPKKVDASFYTSSKRMATTQTFFTSSRVGVINNVADPSGTGTTSLQKSVRSTTKANGGRVPDASSFTAYVGGQAIGKDIQSGLPPARLTANSNSAGSISRCVAIPEPAPFRGGSFAPNNVPMNSGSGYFGNTKHCDEEGRPEPHTANELGAPLFVDTMRPAVPSSNTCQNSQQAPCKPVIHTHPTIAPHPTFPNRPAPTPMGPKLSTDIGRKVGAAIARKPYIEKHHGNDGNVNPRRIPRKYQIPAGAPAHLKINDPQMPKTPF